jgi:molecular chaperone Hsp33
MTNGDRYIKATAAEGSLRAIGAVTTDSVRAAQAAQHAAPLAAAAMGRLMTAAALLAADFKEPSDSVRLEVEGGGPLGRVMADADGRGVLRGRVDHGDVDLPLTPAGKLAVGQAVGRDGRLVVVTHMGTGAPYVSVSPLVSGEIGEDVAHYLVQAVQRRSGLAVGVLVGVDGIVAAAGGLLVEALPGCAGAVVEGVAERLTALDRLSHRLAAGEDMTALMAGVLPPPIVWTGPVPLGFGCRCSREHSWELVAALPADERRRMVTEGGAEVVCHYCRTAYRFSAADLERSLDGAVDASGP